MASARSWFLIRVPICTNRSLLVVLPEWRRTSGPSHIPHEFS